MLSCHFKLIAHMHTTSFNKLSLNDAYQLAFYKCMTTLFKELVVSLLLKSEQTQHSQMRLSILRHVSIAIAITPSVR